MTESTNPGASRTRPIRSVSGDAVEKRTDRLAVEEPMEIRVAVEEAGRLRVEPIAVTMRTPGDDFELAVGFLWGEAAILAPTEVAGVRYCDSEEESARNVVEVTLTPQSTFSFADFQRNVYTSSSCGICGRTSIDRVRVHCPNLADRGEALAASVLHAFPKRLREAQGVFATTGGLHAAAVFDSIGEIVDLREDVGRHNALDKVVGRWVLDGGLPRDGSVLVVSGRASYELVQKAARAGLATLAAVGAPSSLAVELAEECGMTLIGFLRDQRFNVYCGAERIR